MDYINEENIEMIEMPESFTCPRCGDHNFYVPVSETNAQPYQYGCRHYTSAEEAEQA